MQIRRRLERQSRHGPPPRRRGTIGGASRRQSFDWEPRPSESHARMFWRRELVQTRGARVLRACKAAEFAARDRFPRPSACWATRPSQDVPRKARVSRRITRCASVAHGGRGLARRDSLGCNDDIKDRRRRGRTWLVKRACRPRPPALRRRGVTAPEFPPCPGRSRVARLASLRR